MSNQINLFQSTHSLRSATYYEGAKRFAYVVSIHALLAECDLVSSSANTSRTTFQSTHSLRSATDSKNLKWIL